MAVFAPKGEAVAQLESAGEPLTDCDRGGEAEAREDRLSPPSAPPLGEALLHALGASALPEGLTVARAVAAAVPLPKEVKLGDGELEGVGRGEAEADREERGDFEGCALPLELAQGVEKTVAAGDKEGGCVAPPLKLPSAVAVPLSDTEPAMVRVGLEAAVAEAAVDPVAPSTGD